MRDLSSQIRDGTHARCSGSGVLTREVCHCGFDLHFPD